VKLAVSEDELAWWVEIDRGTEHHTSLRNKCERYVDYYKTGLEEQALGFFPRVLFVVSDEIRADDVRRAVKATRNPVDGLFCATSSNQILRTLLGAVEALVL